MRKDYSKQFAKARITKPAAEAWWKHTMAVVRAAVDYQEAWEFRSREDEDAALTTLLRAVRAYRKWVSGRLDPAARKKAKR